MPPSSIRTSSQAATTCQLLADDCNTDMVVSVQQLTDDEDEPATDDDSTRGSDFQMGDAVAALTSYIKARSLLYIIMHHCYPNFG